MARARSISLAVLMITASVILSCNPAAAPTSTTKPPSQTPTATTASLQPTATSAPTPTRLAATPTPNPIPPTPTTTSAPPATPTSARVFGQFNISADKLGVRYPYAKPDFSLAPKKGGTLKIPNRLVWPHFDVSKASTAGILGPLAPAYSKLVVCKGPLEMTSPNTLTCEPGPRIAQSWETSDGGKVYTFHLRQGVKWQNLPLVNGRELTADDVKWTYDLFMKGGPRATSFDLVAKVEATDKYTVKITLKSPYPDFVLSALADQYSFILPREIADRDGDLGKTIVGSGPFQVKQTFGKERILYEKNPNYFIPGAPLLDAIDYSLIADFATTRAAFRAGQIHLGGGDNLTPAEMRAFVGSAPNAIPYIIEPAFSYVFLTRLDKAPFNDVRVRRAISMAIDRPGIVKDIFEGEASIQSPIPWQYMYDARPSLDQLPYYKYDPAAAKKLLADAGYPNGIKFTSNFYPYAAIQQQIAIWLDNLKAVGIDVSLLQQDNTAFNSALLTHSYDSAATGYTVGGRSSMDGWLYFNMYSTSQSNYGGIKNADLDKLLGAQQVEVDPAKRITIARQVFQMEADQVWRIPFVKSNTIQYQSNKIHNFVYHESMIPAYGLASTLDYLWVDP